PQRRDPLSFPPRRSSDLPGAHRRPAALRAGRSPFGAGAPVGPPLRHLRPAFPGVLGAKERAAVVVDIRYHLASLVAVFFALGVGDRKSTRLNSSHVKSSY